MPASSPLSTDAFEALDQLERATEPNSPQPLVPLAVAEELGAFGFVRSDGLGGLEITAEGRKHVRDVRAFR